MHHSLIKFETAQKMFENFLVSKATKIENNTLNPIPHGVFWITHTWGGQILPAPLEHSHFKRYGFEIWHASITFYCLFKTVKNFMQII